MKELNIGLIGFGYFGKFHAKAVQGIEGMRLSAVVGRSFSSADDEILPPTIARLSDAEELFSDTAIDAVIIATPPSTHLPLIKDAVRAGKHVFVEKPVVGSMEESKDLAATLANCDKCFMAGHIYFFNNNIRAMKKLIEQGEIGTVRYVQFRQMSRGPIRIDANCLWEIGVHHLSIMDYLFDAPALTFAGGVAARVVPNGQDDFVSVGLGYANGLTASLTVSWFSPEKEKQTVVVGDKGMLVFDDVQRKLMLLPLEYPTPNASAHHSIWMDASLKSGLVAVEVKDPMTQELEHFAECIRSSIEPQTGLEHTIRMTEQLDFISKHIVRPT